MGLPHQRPTAVRQTVEQHDLPQRTAAVQAMRVEIRDPVQELVLVARRGERRVSDVRSELEARIPLPAGPRESARPRCAELLAVARQQVQALLEMLSQLPDGRRLTAGRARRTRALRRCASARFHLPARAPGTSRQARSAGRLADIRGSSGDLGVVFGLDSESADRGGEALVVADQQAQFDRVAVVESRVEGVPGRV